MSPASAASAMYSETSRCGSTTTARPTGLVADQVRGVRQALEVVLGELHRPVLRRHAMRVSIRSNGTRAARRIASGVSIDADLAARYRRVFPSFLTPYYAEPISIDHGSGSYVWITRRHAVPRLLRRRADHDDRPRSPRGHRRRAGAGREGDAHLDALPVAADDRVRRDGVLPPRASPTPACTSRRRAARPTTRRCCSPPRTASRARCWRSATATTGAGSPRRP